MPEVTDPLGALKEAVDALVAEDPARLSDRESIKDLYRQLSRVEAVTARATPRKREGPPPDERHSEVTVLPVGEDRRAGLADEGSEGSGGRATLGSPAQTSSLPVPPPGVRGWGQLPSLTAFGTAHRRRAP